MKTFEEFQDAIFGAKNLDELERVTNLMRESENLTEEEKMLLDADSYGIYDCMQAKEYAELWDGDIIHCTPFI